ncbi:MAG: formyltetrahydrofolate deformylase [Burkholderiaceae bacterium]
MSESFIITLSCPDRLGIVYAVTGCLAGQRANITEAAQFNDASTGLFFMRVRFDVADGADGANAALREAFAPIAAAFDMKWGLFNAAERLPTIVMVSRLGHCLNHLLFRHSTHPLPLDIRAIVSNHRDFYQLAASHDIPFHHVPVTPSTKERAEARLLEIVAQENAELVVLARYMQVLSGNLCRELEGRAINIHHSFLPSFKGAKPYQQAFDRGVKTIGATAHYVTADLDEGPIIEQATARADHTMDATALTMIGRDIESAVLTRAVEWHAEHRVLINGHKTVVFG